MDLDFSAAETAFRSTVRTFLAAELPQDIQHKVRNGLQLDSQDYMRWQRLLHTRGWGAPAWPVSLGGCGWNAVEQFIFEEEAAMATTRKSVTTCRAFCRGKTGGVRAIQNPEQDRTWPH